MKVKMIPAPQILQEDVAGFRITEHDGNQRLALNVCINGLPGIVFQHHEGLSPLEAIATPLGRRSFQGQAPTLFVYGQIMQRGVMHYHPTPFTSTQVLLKPHALRSLFGIHAAELTNQVIPLGEFTPTALNDQLLDAKCEAERVGILTKYLVALKKRAKNPDLLIQQGLSLIHDRIYEDGASLRVSSLVEELAISESQFERRFTQSVGVSPQFYLRVQRFNQALRLIKSRRFAKLTDIAHSLNFYDQSHFIRDIKEFSGLTPKRIFQKEIGLYQDQGGYFYV